MQSGTIKTAPKIIKIPCAVRPREMTMMPMMMQAMATGHTMNHVPQPRIGMSETRNVAPRRIQLTNARVRIPLRGG